MGETSIVNMVQRASKKVLLEPGDTRQQWKGEAATSFVSLGSPVAARYRPPASATGPLHYLVLIQGLRRDVILRGRFLARNSLHEHSIRPAELGAVSRFASVQAQPGNSVNLASTVRQVRGRSCVIRESPGHMGVFRDDLSRLQDGRQVVAGSQQV